MAAYDKKEYGSNQRSRSPSPVRKTEKQLVMERVEVVSVIEEIKMIENNDKGMKVICDIIEKVRKENFDWRSETLSNEDKLLLEIIIETCVYWNKGEIIKTIMYGNIGFVKESSILLEWACRTWNSEMMRLLISIEVKVSREVLKILLNSKNWLDLEFIMKHGMFQPYAKGNILAFVINRVKKYSRSDIKHFYNIFDKINFDWHEEVSKNRTAIYELINFNITRKRTISYWGDGLEDLIKFFYKKGNRFNDEDIKLIIDGGYTAYMGLCIDELDANAIFHEKCSLIDYIIKCKCDLVFIIKFSIVLDAKYHCITPSRARSLLSLILKCDVKSSDEMWDFTVGYEYEIIHLLNCGAPIYNEDIFGYIMISRYQHSISWENYEVISLLLNCHNFPDNSIKSWSISSSKETMVLYEANKRNLYDAHKEAYKLNPEKFDTIRKMREEQNGYRDGDKVLVEWPSW